MWYSGRAHRNCVIVRGGQNPIPNQSGNQAQFAIEATIEHIYTGALDVITYFTKLKNLWEEL